MGHQSFSKIKFSLSRQRPGPSALERDKSNEKMTSFSFLIIDQYDWSQLIVIEPSFAVKPKPVSGGIFCVHQRRIPVLVEAPVGVSRSSRSQFFTSGIKRLEMTLKSLKITFFLNFKRKKSYLWAALPSRFLDLRDRSIAPAKCSK